MRLINSKWSYSATDLANFLRCEHRVELDRRLQLGQLEKPKLSGSPHTDLLIRYGGEHEEKYLESLRASGKNIVEIPDREEISAAEASELTLDAMKDGVDVIFQARLSDGIWSGYADFLERVPLPSRFGDWSYEIADTKLARNIHPPVVLQLGVYSDLLTSIQGVAPERLHVILGDGTPVSLERSELDAYIRHVRERFISGVDREPGTEKLTRPYPVDFCGLCHWNDRCYWQWVDEDDLCLVADIRRDQIKRLEAAGIHTLTQLGQANPSSQIPEIAAPTFEKLTSQAELQLHHKRTGEHIYKFLDHDERRGFQRLPVPSPGDLFFDVEADPFHELIYLFGIGVRATSPLAGRLPADPDHPTYIPLWAHTESEERGAFEQTIDLIRESRQHYPGAHVYHYGPADVIALKKMMGKFGTREQELDDLLRRETFIDLMSIVRQSIRISHPRYSLKKVETYYTDRESEGVIDAGGAIVAYENWLAERDPAILDEIADYNRKDCQSTEGLQSWLLKLREEYQEKYGVNLDWAEPREPEKTTEDEENDKVQSDALSAALHAALAENRDTWADGDHARWILGHLLHYHRRDTKPGWWEHFNRMTLTPEELVEDKEAIGLLEATGDRRAIKQSVGVEFRFPSQLHKLSPGDDVRDPELLNEKGYAWDAGSIRELDDDEGTLWLKRGPGLKDQRFPRAIIPKGPIDDKIIRSALRRFAQSVIDDGFGETSYDAARDILLRRPPRIAGLERGKPIQEGDLEVHEIVDIARRLDRSALFIQGPPGSGKTYRGARIIIDLIAGGKRVGVCATSHKAIENLLQEVEKQATKSGVTFRGLKKSSAEQAFVSRLPTPLIRDTSDKKKSFPGETKWKEDDPDIKLVAGTPWCFSADRHDQQFDVLIIDEAGQMALATALAVSTAARSVILLGDPLQLAQVSQGTHPDGCGVSVLEHLLGDDPTIPAERGIFLEHTRRMHPDVCRFISTVVYDNRLESAEECAANVLTFRGAESTTSPHVQRETAAVEPGGVPQSGLLYLPVDHTNNSQDSSEEADTIATIATSLLDGTNVTTYDWSQERAVTRPLNQDHMLVVTPYNAQVRQIKRTLTAAGLPDIRVGTVDKFQGQEAPIVFFSMATSSGEEVPRTLDFLFSRHRLNVAISRAQCLAILVASPKLLDVHCRTIEQMKLVNSLCRFVEMAESLVEHAQG